MLTLTLSVIVGTLVDFQFKLLAEQHYPERNALTRFLGGFHAVLNGFAMLVQFTAAGWILRHLGLGFSAAVQPGSVLAFSLWSVLAPVWGVVLALRWVQGVVFQTLGKSASDREPDATACSGHEGAFAREVEFHGTTLVARRRFPRLPTTRLPTMG